MNHIYCWIAESIYKWDNKIYHIHDEIFCLVLWCKLETLQSGKFIFAHLFDNLKENNDQKLKCKLLKLNGILLNLKYYQQIDLYGVLNDFPARLLGQLVFKVN